MRSWITTAQGNFFPMILGTMKLVGLKYRSMSFVFLIYFATAKCQRIPFGKRRRGVGEAPHSCPSSTKSVRGKFLLRSSAITHAVHCPFPVVSALNASRASMPSFIEPIVPSWHLHTFFTFTPSKSHCFCAILNGMARASSFLRALKYLEIEEKVLNIGSLLAILGIFMPWFGGEWSGQPKVWTGLGFYTSFVGLLILLAHIFTLALTVLPLLGYSVIRISLRDIIRFTIGIETVFLVVMVLSILTNVSFDFSQVEVRFGIYLTLVGSIIVSLYAFLRMQQERKRSAQELFHHPEDAEASLLHVQKERSPEREVPPPPPPPPPPAEDPPLFS